METPFWDLGIKLELDTSTNLSNDNDLRVNCNNQEKLWNSLIVSFQVKPPSTLDPCLSSPDEVATKLKSYIHGVGNKLDGFLKKGELAQAAQLSLSVLKSANEKNDCGQALDPDAKRFVS